MSKKGEGFKSFSDAFQAVGLKTESPKEETVDFAPASVKQEGKEENPVREGSKEKNWTPEDQVALQAIARKLDLLGRSKMTSGQENRYWRIRDAIRDSHERDSSSNLGRWTGTQYGSSDSELEALLVPIRKRAYLSGARSWIQSALPEGMRYGTDTREMRIEKAREYAKKAGVDFETLAREYSLDE